MASPNLCCCCSLTTGGKIIAILEIIGGILLILGDAFIMSEPSIAVKNTRDPSWMNPTDGRNPYAGVASTMVKVDYYAAASVLVFGIGLILIGVLLFTGIRKKSPDLLKIWIIIRVILSVSAILLRPSINIIVFLPVDVWFIAIVHYLRKEFLDDQSENMAPVSFNP